jgi:hypothetical protein
MFASRRGGNAGGAPTDQLRTSKVDAATTGFAETGHSSRMILPLTWSASEFQITWSPFEYFAIVSSFARVTSVWAYPFQVPRAWSVCWRLVFSGAGDFHAVRALSDMIV